MLLLKALIYKPIVDYWLGEIGFSRMVFRVMTRWSLIMVISIGVIFAYVWTAPGVVTGKLGAPNTLEKERMEREEAYQKRKAGSEHTRLGSRQ